MLEEGLELGWKRSDVERGWMEMGRLLSEHAVRKVERPDSSDRLHGRNALPAASLQVLAVSAPIRICSFFSWMLCGGVPCNQAERHAAQRQTTVWVPWWSHHAGVFFTMVLFVLWDLLFFVMIIHLANVVRLIFADGHLILSFTMFLFKMLRCLHLNLHMSQ